MDTIWIWPLAVVAFLLAWPALRASLSRVTSTPFASQALDEQPDRISLVRVGEPRWRNPEPRDVADRQLTAAGFVDAGAWVVREMPELTLGLYANPRERSYAVIYDHPRSGSWVEFVTRYDDGTLANYSTLEPVDVEVPEGSVHLAAPELGVGDLWKRMLAERPQRPMRECSRAAAAKDFERGYADSVAHHKRNAAPPESTPHDVERVA